METDLLAEIIKIAKKYGYQVSNYTVENEIQIDFGLIKGEIKK